MNAANLAFDMMQLAPLFKGFKIKTTTSPFLLSGKVKAAQKAVTEKAVNVGTKPVSPGFNAYPFNLPAKVYLSNWPFVIFPDAKSVNLLFKNISRSLPFKTFSGPIFASSIILEIISVKPIAL